MTASQQSDEPSYESDELFEVTPSDYLLDPDEPALDDVDALEDLDDELLAALFDDVPDAPCEPDRGEWLPWYSARPASRSPRRRRRTGPITDLPPIDDYRPPATTREVNP